MLVKQISELMNERGLTYEESLLFINHFYVSEGDYSQYTTIRATTQIARRRLGLEPLAESEVLDIALEYYGVERLEEKKPARARSLQARLQQEQK
jgi:hypothetical protein